AAGARPGGSAGRPNAGQTHAMNVRKGTSPRGGTGRTTDYYEEETGRKNVPSIRCRFMLAVATESRFHSERIGPHLKTSFAECKIKPATRHVIKYCTGSCRGQQILTAVAKNRLFRETRVLFLEE